jgi:hypothetical protein
VGALVTSAEEDRIRIWSAYEDEEQLLAASSLGGALPVDDTEVHVGVLVNDTTGGTMDYYSDAAISTAVGMCDGDYHADPAPCAEVGVFEDDAVTDVRDHGGPPYGSWWGAQRPAGLGEGWRSLGVTASVARAGVHRQCHRSRLSPGRLAPLGVDRSMPARRKACPHGVAVVPAGRDFRP